MPPATADLDAEVVIDPDDAVGYVEVQYETNEEPEKEQMLMKNTKFIVNVLYTQLCTQTP